MKKLLILGAMTMHVPLIKRAKELGIYVITCDYIPENEGHRYADEAHYDSTTDFNAVLKLAQDCKVDGVMTYNSDPAALTAAYVSGKLSLPGSGYQAVEIMSEKDKFRSFLKDNGFNVPYFKQYTSVECFKRELHDFKLPVMIKPVDSSGSKGIVKIDSLDDIDMYFTDAMQYSRCKRVIVEEYIDRRGAQLHGDGYVRDGELDFIYLGDHYFNEKENDLVPMATTFPSQHLTSDVARVEDEVRRFIKLVGFKQGGLNIEARISNRDNKVYLIEIGPRNGGHFTPAIIEYASGYNFIDANLASSLNLEYFSPAISKHGFYSNVIMRCSSSGIFQKVELSEVLQQHIIEQIMYVEENTMVNSSYEGANAAIGVLLCKFDSVSQMQSIVGNMHDYIKIILQ